MSRASRAGRWLFSASVVLIAAARVIADGSIHIAWDQVNDPSVVGYNLYYGPASHAYKYVVSVGPVASATVSGLQEGNTYYFALVTCSSNGAQSDFSGEISQLIPATTHSATAYAAISGNYDGLLFENDQIHQTSAGFFSLFVNGAGAYSGHLQSGFVRASFHGQLDPGCQGTSVAVGPNNSFTIQFRIGGTSQPDRLVGKVSDGVTVSSLQALRSPFNSHTLHAPFAGQYTCVFPGHGPTAPQGYGFGVVHVSPSGSAALAGTLADGTHISQAAPVSEGGFWPLYVPLYSGKGSLASLLTFTNQLNDDVSGVMNWTKPGMPNDRYYSAGFTNESQVFGSSYSVPTPITEPILDLSKAYIAFSRGDLGAGFTNAISIGYASQVTSQSSNDLDMSFSISTGTFMGTVVNPLDNSLMPFSGIVFQKNTNGYGFLLGTNQSSSVFLGP